MSASVKIANRVSRLRQMSWHEIRTRSMQEACKRWDLIASKSPRRTAGRGRIVPFGGAGRFFFDSSSLPEILGALQSRQPAASDSIIREADQIRQHKFNLLGYRGVDCGRTIDWHSDPVNRKTSPRVAWFRVPYLDFTRVGDHKVIWELNRHQHMVTLAKACRLTGESSYARELFVQWYQWHDQNPYPIGINWASSLEVAFRSLSWLWVWHLLHDSPLMPSRFSADLTQALMTNGRHIERYLSTYFAPNTHLLGEAVALFFIGALAPKCRSVRRWKETGWKLILDQAERQVLADGMHFEQATYYHVYALDLFLHARLLAAANGVAIPAGFDGTIERMLDALRVMSESGPTPQFGDDDGGRVFDPRRNRREHLRDPLAIGTALFGRGDMKTAVQNPTEELVWLLGLEGLNRFESMQATERNHASAALTASGIYILCSQSGLRQQLVIDAGPQGPGWAGHGHADALSIQLSFADKPVLVDPGTYSYVDSTKDRELFRSTAHHSTVQVDGASQAESVGPFKWKCPVHARVERWIRGDGFDFFTGFHTGYHRLTDPVSHRRTVFNLASEFYFVRDVLEGVGAHQVDLSLMFAPGSLVVTGNKAYFRGDDGAMLTSALAGSDGLRCTVSEGGYSPCYGEREPAPLLRATANLQLPTECATVLIPGIKGDACLEQTLHTMSVRHAGCVCEYRLLLEHRMHEMYFSDLSCIWNVGPIVTDARFFYCLRDERGNYARFIACDVTYLEVHGRVLLSSNSRLESKEWSVTQDAAGDLPPVLPIRESEYEAERQHA
jgi:Heparinase II/III-like protein/Heparinase II/III N-terminus